MPNSSPSWLDQTSWMEFMAHAPEFQFELEGHPLGFTVARDMRAKSARQSWAYAKLVREAFDFEFGTVLKASKDCVYMVYTEAYYKTGRHCDPENTHKLVKDALFYEAGGDKYTCGAYAPPMIDKENPRLVVRIWEVT